MESLCYVLVSSVGGLTVYTPLTTGQHAFDPQDIAGHVLDSGQPTHPIIRLRLLNQRHHMDC